MNTKAETGKAGAEEPSMEDILQSIRRIIADDGEAGAEGTPAESGQQSASGADSGSDVLELTDMIADEEPASPPPEPVVHEDVLGRIDAALSPTPPAPIPVEQPVAEALPSLSPDDRLISNEAAAASAAALKRVVKEKMSSTYQSTPSPAFRNGSSVEDLVMEALRPMLKDWLDTNLPGMVQRIVEREVKKLASSD